MPACSAYGCKNRPDKRPPGVTFHKFPSKYSLRNAWITACKRKDWIPSKRSMLCSQHFSEDQIDRTSLSIVRLRANAIPNIFEAFPLNLQNVQADYSVNCVAINCDSNVEKNEPGVTFHSFPQEYSLRIKWTSAVGITNWFPTLHSTLCSKHFTEDQFDRFPPGNTFLKPGAVPIVFPENPSKSEEVPASFLAECAALKCDSHIRKNEPGVTFYLFPQEFDLRIKWTSALGKKNWFPTLQSTLCSKHFTENQFDRFPSGDISLKPDAVPCIFPGNPSNYELHSDELASCVAVDCDSHVKKCEPGVTFHLFPEESNLKEKWTSAAGIKNTMLLSTLCSKHFTEDQFDRFPSGNIYLKPLAVPCIFPGNSSNYEETRKALSKHKSLSEEDRNGSENSMSSVSLDIPSSIGEFPENTPFLFTERSGETFDSILIDEDENSSSTENIIGNRKNESDKQMQTLPIMHVIPAPLSKTNNIVSFEKLSSDEANSLSNENSSLLSKVADILHFKLAATTEVNTLSSNIRVCAIPTSQPKARSIVSFENLSSEEANALSNENFSLVSKVADVLHSYSAATADINELPPIAIPAPPPNISDVVSYGILSPEDGNSVTNENSSFVSKVANILRSHSATTVEVNDLPPNASLQLMQKLFSPLADQRKASLEDDLPKQYLKNKIRRALELKKRYCGKIRIMNQAISCRRKKLKILKRLTLSIKRERILD